MGISPYGAGTQAGFLPGASSVAPTQTVVLASANGALRARLRDALVAKRWQVREAEGGAAAMVYLEDLQPEALIVDGWLPDLEIGEFARCVQLLYPATDLLRVDEPAAGSRIRSPRRHELLQVLRDLTNVPDTTAAPADRSSTETRGDLLGNGGSVSSNEPAKVDESAEPTPVRSSPIAGFLPEMVGTSPAMAELGHLVRLVAPRSTTVLIEGETGTGKELVAKALHRLSPRANKPFLVLNCAAIPEALLEAELFGHTRGAFTGAVRSRIGRIEAAHGGTLFLDEIGEMPLALQAKMLRFLECGELQRVGDNEPTYVDVRVIAATHQPLEQRSEQGAFRLDLYHRLAVFPIEVPSLRSRVADIPLLAAHFLTLLGRSSAAGSLSKPAIDRLLDHHWPGNVRELMHVLERALILAGPGAQIGPDQIRVRRRDRSA